MITKGLLITGSRAMRGDGGVFYLSNTGDTTITMNPLTLTRTIAAAENGGIARIAGAAVTISITALSIETCEAIGKSGGGFYFANSGQTQFTIPSGEISGYCKAG